MWRFREHPSGAYRVWTRRRLIPSLARLRCMATLGFRHTENPLPILPAYARRAFSPVLPPDHAAHAFYGTMADADLF